MFFNFIDELRAAGIKASFKEHLVLLEALDKDVIEQTPEAFYYLSRATFVKDEGLLDRFDQVFAKVFKGIEPTLESETEIPEDWLRALAEMNLSEEERAELEKMGWDKLMETLRQRLAEQKGRHQGGSKWIGTAGTSPFGAYGYNPEGVRIGQEESRNRRAAKVWDKRVYKDLDEDEALSSRNMKVALRRLRRFARTGAATELDMPGTIGATARNGGSLDLHMVPERRNAVKVLLLMDIGGSMDDHIRICQELFSAARGEFKHLEFYYFHNCPYERLWRENRRRKETEKTTQEVLRTYGPDWRLVFVGDATMGPYEISQPGGSVEHWNEESGVVWMGRLTRHFRRAAWLNPVDQQHWRYTHSIGMMQGLMENRMHPLTLAGLESMARELAK